jgi:predicted enzyme related to lactoylglutathione lyase
MIGPAQRRRADGGASVERVTGIGGVFLRANDPQALARWYTEHLGVNAFSENDDAVWWQEEGPTVWAPFPMDTDYFGAREQTWMVNFRVRDLDAMLAQLRAAGVGVDDDVETMEGIGRFGWATDPEGNRFELWEPAPEALNRP